MMFLVVSGALVQQVQYEVCFQVAAPITPFGNIVSASGRQPGRRMATGQA